MECKRCHYEWEPRVKTVKACPKCKSYFWDTEPKSEKKDEPVSKPDKIPGSVNTPEEVKRKLDERPKPEAGGKYTGETVYKFGILHYVLSNGDITRTPP